MKRYAAKLMFQFRVVVGGESSKRRTCEDRIILIRAKSATSALLAAKRHGRKSEHSYSNDEGNPVHFEFVGVMDLLELGLECAEDEVWYEIVDRLCPSERRSKLIPPEWKLNAVFWELPRKRKQK
jgi:hypothetical protein